LSNKLPVNHGEGHHRSLQRVRSARQATIGRVSGNEKRATWNEDLLNPFLWEFRVIKLEIVFEGFKTLPCPAHHEVRHQLGSTLTPTYLSLMFFAALLTPFSGRLGTSVLGRQARENDDLSKKIHQLMSRLKEASYQRHDASGDPFRGAAITRRRSLFMA
jgi:hypothetical protein